jgi:Uma2 family endonuclease
MATNTVIPVSEYLRTAYSPDCDYVDGSVQERNMGETDHGELQGQLLELLRAPASKAYFRTTPEVRVQVAATRFRVPDVCLRRIDAPKEQIIRTPPLLCIEVLSPEDRMSRMREKVRDYLDMGVVEVWVVDPETRGILVYTGTTMAEHTTGELAVPGTPVKLALADVFKILDEY